MLQSTACCFDAFQWLTTFWLNENLRTSSLSILFCNLSLCPRRLPSASWKKSFCKYLQNHLQSWTLLSSHLSVFEFPGLLLVIPNAFNLSGYDKTLSSGCYLVILFVLSPIIRCQLRYGRHACTQYSKQERTSTLYSDSNLSLVLFRKHLLITPNTEYDSLATLLNWLPTFSVLCTTTPTRDGCKNAS